MKLLLDSGLENARLAAWRSPRGMWIPGLMLLTVALIAAAADGQTTTQASPQGGTQTQSPFWGGSPDSAPAPGHREYDRGRGGRYGYREGFDDAFPTGLVGEVAPAHANYIAMKWGYRTSRSAVWQRAGELRKDFENSEEYLDLRRQLNEAQAALEQARQEAYAPLQEDPEYVAAGELHRSLEARIQRMHQEENADPAEIAAMSEQAMKYAMLQREMELAEAGEDGGIADARERLEELIRRQREMEAQFEQRVRDDEQLRQMRAEMSHLKVARMASGAYYDSAVRAANVATRFAYTRQYLRSPWYGRPGYLSPYAYGAPYGYGGYFPSGFIIAGPGAGGLGPRQIELGNTFPPMFGTGVPFVGTGAQVNSAPTIPPEAFTP